MGTGRTHGLHHTVGDRAIGDRTVDDSMVARLVDDASAAPSMHNTQPWRFRYLRAERTFQLRADLTRVMPHHDPELRALHMACGAALLNLRVAVAEEGLAVMTTLLPDPADEELLASVRLERPTGGGGGPLSDARAAGRAAAGGDPRGSAPAATGAGSGTGTESETGAGSDDLALLHPFVHIRNSSRFPFEETPIPAAVQVALAEASRCEGVDLAFPAGWHLDLVLDLIRTGEERYRADEGARADRAAWTRTETPGGDGGAPQDGVPRYAFGPRERGGRVPGPDYESDTGAPLPVRDTATFERDPHLVLLSTPRDGAHDWLRAGQAMERVLLLAARSGLASSFLTQAVEWPDLRWPLRDPVSGRGNVQMVLRIGYGPHGPSTPRRAAGDVLDFE
ncbi:nitroreductase [Streptomyces sp. NPDC058001]|uniref:nitroreductase n=1 Tax=Streptomyces sp. NPDC058001 TaxID=3346300 RepID=UPI0036F09224